MTRVPIVLVVFAAAAWAGTRVDPAAGCGVAPRFGESINVDDEAAYIVWDEKTKTEHFIRRATFAGTSADFGFLVPTPNRPQLEGVATDPNSGRSLFNELASITAPKVEYQTVTRAVSSDFGIGCLGTGKSAAKPELAEGRAPGGGVEVLEQKRVGDYDAAVLTFRREPGETAAAGAAELSEWLTKHGYQSSPALKTWLERYVADEWCMTAFKIAADATPAAGPRGDLRAKPIRMSFKVDKPFYPYREPAAEAGANARPRLLRVFLAAPARFAGTLGAAGEWPGRTVWSGPVESGRQGVLFGLSAMASEEGQDGKKIERTPPATDGWWLTEFEDRSSPRPGTDEVYFDRAADQTPVARPPVIVTHTRDVIVTPWWHGAVYLGVPAVLVVGGLLAWRLLRRGL